jgi:CRP-like cAMP-binding protein
VTPRDLQQIEALVRVRSVARGGFFFQQGALPDAIYILTQGVAKIGRVDHKGRQVILRIVTPPEPFGCVAAIGGGGSDFAQALTDCQALRLDTATFLRVIQDPTVAQNALRLLAAWLRDARERLQDLGARHVTQRLARALLRAIPPAQWGTLGQPAITLVLSHQNLAEIVGASLYTVSRVLSEWKRVGIVDVKRGRVVVRRAEELMGLAEGIMQRGATGVRVG